MANDVRLLYIYSLNLHPDVVNGYATNKYVRSERPVKVYLVPSTTDVQRTEKGLVPSAEFKGYVIDYDGFKLGDRLGTADKQEFEVVSLLTLEVPIRQQQMGLKVLWRR